jgi:hypothetical protein
MQNNKHPRSTEWVNKMLNQLKVLAMIDLGDKLCTETPMFSLQPSGFQQTVWRTLSGESRVRNLRAIADVVTSVIDHVESHVPTSGTWSNMTDKQLILQLVEALKQAQNGLQNLTWSYNYDKTTTAQIDTIIETIEQFVVRCTHHGILRWSAKSQGAAGEQLTIED